MARKFTHVARAVHRPVAVQVDFQVRWAVVAEDAETCPPHTLVPVVGSQPEMRIAGLGQHGEITLEGRRRTVDMRLEDPIRTGLTGGQLAAILGVNCDRRPGHRLLVLQVDRPHESVAGAQLECQVGMAQHHQERPGVGCACGRVWCAGNKAGRQRAGFRGQERNLHCSASDWVEIDRQDPGNGVGGLVRLPQAAPSGPSNRRSPAAAGCRSAKVAPVRLVVWAGI